MSYVIPKCVNFPFLSKCDYEIGPCHTDGKYKGLDIYPHVLRYITSHVGKDKTEFYMLVHPTNTASVRGVEKDGFHLWKQVKRSKTGIYNILKK